MRLKKGFEGYTKNLKNMSKNSVHIHPSQNQTLIILFKKLCSNFEDSLENPRNSTIVTNKYLNF